MERERERYRDGERDRVCGPVEERVLKAAELVSVRDPVVQLDAILAPLRLGLQRTTKYVTSCKHCMLRMSRPESTLSRACFTCACDFGCEYAHV